MIFTGEVENKDAIIRIQVHMHRNINYPISPPIVVIIDGFEVFLARVLLTHISVLAARYVRFHKQHQAVLLL